MEKKHKKEKKQNKQNKQKNKEMIKDKYTIDKCKKENK